MRRGIRIYPDGPLSGLWVPIRYERLPELCSYCGLISHSSRGCALFLQSENRARLSQQYGDWLQYTRKGMMPPPVLIREDNSAHPPYVSQGQRTPMAVTPTSVPVPTVNELPRTRFNGIRISEPVDAPPQQPSRSFSQDPRRFKGKEKILDAETKGKMVMLDSDSRWRPEAQTGTFLRRGSKERNC